MTLWQFSTPSKRASKSVTQWKCSWHKSLCATHVWQTQNCTTTNVKEEKKWIDDEDGLRRRRRRFFETKYYLVGKARMLRRDTHLMKQRKLFVEERDVEKGRQQNMCVISLHHFWLQKCVSTTTTEPQFFLPPPSYLLMKVHLLGWFVTDSPLIPQLGKDTYTFISPILPPKDF